MRTLGKLLRSGPGFPVLSPIVLAATIAWAPVDARASAITYEYGGVITSADPASGVAPGARFSGTFTYDPADLAQGIQTQGNRNYLFGTVPGFPSPASVGVDGLTLSVGGRSIASMSPVLGVGLYEPELGGIQPLTGAVTHPTHLNINNGGGTTGAPITVALNLSNPDRTVYSSLAMPSTISLADFPSAVLNVTPYFTQPGSTSSMTFAGTIDTLNAIPAPEPATAIVLGVGLAAWLARSKFGKSRRPS